ncbi:TetR/AcrR family transcriptional regulator [Arthrobacter sp. Z4-13]
MSGSAAALEQARQSSVQRQEILLVTESLLAKRGFDGIRLRDVSVAAGVSIGLIQHYFFTRDDLVRETLEQASLRRAEHWIQSAVGSDDGSTKVRDLLLDAVADRERCTIWIETCAAASRYPELQALTTRTSNVWRQVLQEAIDLGVSQGSFAPTAPTGRVVDVLVSLIDGMMLEVAVQNGDFTLDYINSLLLDVASAQLGHNF